MTISHPRVSGTPPTIADLQLAAYVSSARQQGRSIDPDTIHALNAANSAMAEVRTAIPRRGNVRGDHIATDGTSTYELLALRRAAKEETLIPTSAINCALSLSHGVGACGEMSRVTQLYLADRLQASQQACRVVLKPEIANHALVVIKSGTTSVIAADTWTKGPAVVPQDSRFAQRAKNLDHDQTMIVDRESGAAPLRELRQAINDVADNRWIQSTLERERKRNEIEREQLRSGLPPETFGEISAVYLERMLSYISKLPSNTSVLNRAFIRRLPDARRAPSFSRRIARAAAMRDLGATVRDAAWFADRNGGAERALLHPDFPDDRLLTPAREAARTLGNMRTPQGRLLDPWSA